MFLVRHCATAARYEKKKKEFLLLWNEISRKCEEEQKIAARRPIGTIFFFSSSLAEHIPPCRRSFNIYLRLHTKYTHDLPP